MEGKSHNPIGKIRKSEGFHSRSRSSGIQCAICHFEAPMVHCLQYCTWCNSSTTATWASGSFYFCTLICHTPSLFVVHRYSHTFRKQYWTRMMLAGSRPPSDFSKGCGRPCTHGCALNRKLCYYLWLEWADRDLNMDLLELHLQIPRPSLDFSRPAGNLHMPLLAGMGRQYWGPHTHLGSLQGIWHTKYPWRASARGQGWGGHQKTSCARSAEDVCWVSSNFTMATSWVTWSAEKGKGGNKRRRPTLSSHVTCYRKFLNQFSGPVFLNAKCYSNDYQKVVFTSALRSRGSLYSSGPAYWLVKQVMGMATVYGLWATLYEHLVFAMSNRMLQF